MKDLFERIQERVPRIVAAKLETHRQQRLANAPDFARFMYETGPGWDSFLKSSSGTDLSAKFENEVWRHALCEVLSALAESQVELGQRVAAIEKEIKNP